MNRFLQLLIFFPSFVLADDFFGPLETDIGVMVQPCTSAPLTLNPSDDPAILALGASWEKGYTTPSDSYITLLRDTLNEEYFDEGQEADLHVLAENDKRLVDVVWGQLDDGCRIVGEHRNQGVVMIIGMTNDISHPVLLSGRCLGRRGNFESCVEAAHAFPGYDGMEVAQQRLSGIAHRLARTAATGLDIDGFHEFAEKTKLIIVQSVNPLDALHASTGLASCATLDGLDPESSRYDFYDLVSWVDFILGSPDAIKSPRFVPDGWMPWRTRTAQVVEEIETNFPNLDVRVLDLHGVLDRSAHGLIGASLGTGTVNNCYHLTERGEERVCRAMANRMGVAGDWCTFADD